MPGLTGLPDDPRRTARSASWAPAAVVASAPPVALAPPVSVAEADEADVELVAEGDGAAADDPSLSVSVVFEPDMLPGAVAAATAAAIAAAKREAESATVEADDPLPADLDGPSLSVSVIFEPDMLPAPGSTSPDLGPPSSIEVPISDGVPPHTPIMAQAPIRGDEATELAVDDVRPQGASDARTEQAAPVASASDFFFDEDFANMPMALPGDAAEEAARALRVSDVPPTEAGAPVFTPRTASLGAALENDSLRGVPPPPDDDDDADTLIRLPGASSANLPVARQAPVPAAGMLASDDARTAARPPPVVSPAARSREELTPTQHSAEVEDAARQKSPTGSSGGRKKKSTHGGGKSLTGGEKKKKKPTRHPADGEAPTQEGTFNPDEVPTDRRNKADDEVETDPLIGRKIAEGKYTIEAAIGAGAAGAVYKAMHRELRRTVGIKVLHPHYQKDPHFMKSFRGEALAASQLDHPNVMRVLDFGQEPDGLVYIVMEFLSGRTLQSLLDEERRLQTDRAVEIMIQVCAALSVAHDNGIIHRDIKPDNIMLVPSRNDEGGSFELVKVCDFGIAALQGPRVMDDDEPSIGDTVIAGTPEYMSPEQARGTQIDARADVYACGICLYELVTGRPPFLGQNAAEILIKQLEEQPRPPSQLIKGLDSLVEEIILRAIQKQPQKRQQSARELRVELKEIIDPGDARSAADEDERSIVENVPVLDDPASGFPGFFIALSSAVLRFGRFERTSRSIGGAEGAAQGDESGAARPSGDDVRAS